MSRRNDRRIERLLDEHREKMDRADLPREHPSEDEIWMFAAGEVGGRERNSISEHLRSCRSCWDVLAEADYGMEELGGIERLEGAGEEDDAEPDRPFSGENDASGERSPLPNRWGVYGLAAVVLVGISLFFLLRWFPGKDRIELRAFVGSKRAELFDRHRTVVEPAREFFVGVQVSHDAHICLVAADDKGEVYLMGVERSGAKSAFQLAYDSHGNLLNHTFGSYGIRFRGQETDSARTFCFVLVVASRNPIPASAVLAAIQEIGPAEETGEWVSKARIALKDRFECVVEFLDVPPYLF